MSETPVWRRIIVHHSASEDGDARDATAIWRFHVEERGWASVGYHGVVERIGNIYQFVSGRSLAMPGAHCPGQNELALGLCLVGDFTKQPPPMDQMRVAAEVCADWCGRFDIPSEEIHPHNRYRATLCPGRVDIGMLRYLVDQIFLHG